MKKCLLLLTFMLVTLCLQAASKLYIDDLKIKPGETKTVELKLQNEDVVKGLQLVITLPEGLSFVEDEEEEAYAVGNDRCVFLSSQIKANGSLGIAGVATKKKDYIAVGDGTIAALLVKADENAALGTGTIKISDVELVFSTNPTENPSASTSDVMVYNVFSVSVSSADESMGNATSSANEAEWGNTVTASATPEEGYHFEKWSDETTDNPYSITVTSDVTLKAIFAPNQYTITFNTNGGSAIANITADYKATLSKPADPTKTGYTFAGWQPEFPKTMPIGGVALNAQWTMVNYSIAYDLAGGTIASTNPTYYTIESDDITLTNPTREGYTFAGWTGTDLTEASTEVKITKGSTGNRSYTATWSTNQYTMTFVLDNGAADITQTMDYGTALSAPADPAKTGFTFKGWSPELPSTIPASDMTFTAQWERNSYVLKFIADGNIIAEDNIPFEGSITIPDAPAKEGYTFTGWGDVVPESMPASDLTFTAQYSINQYTITFVLGNGEENIVVTQDYGTVLTPPATPEWAGHSFIGWDKDIPATIPGLDMTINAQWHLIGDLNGSQTINGSDIVEMVSLIMTNGYQLTADLYPIGSPDGVINGMDLVTEIDLVLAQSVVNEPLHTAKRMPEDIISLKEPKEGTQTFGLRSTKQFVLTQMIVKTSNGIQLNDVTCDKNHHVTYRQIDANEYMIVCYSDQNEVFTDYEDILRFHYTGSGGIQIGEVLLVDTDKEDYNITISDNTTDVSSIASKESIKFDIYSINGNLVKKGATSIKGLPKGIFIANGQKIIIK